MATILLVEDDEISALCIAELFEGNHSFFCANTTDQALDYLKRQSPDVLISDWGVRGALSAAEFATRARSQNPQIKIFFTTGYPETYLMEFLRDLAPYRLFPKPVNFDQLYIEVNAG